ncbi:decaprenyl-phosphate phosphoribosyltransferase [soil metagenome]
MTSPFSARQERQREEAGRIGAPLSILKPETTPDIDLDDTQIQPIAGLPPLIRAMRPLQWSKNLLVFAALIFTRGVFDPDPLMRSIGAFVVFCSISSGIYLVNDVRDMTQDRLHPVKRFRPIAAGDLAPRVAVFTAAVLILAGLIGSLLIKRELMLVVALYVAAMLAYNAGLKNIVILDVMLISLGFVLRAAAGAVAISVPISPWLYICTLLVALLVGFGKRRHEILTLQGAASLHRQNLDAYSVTLLDQIIAISAASTIIAYSIYTFESPTLPDNHAMMVTIPIVVYTVLRYLFLLYKKRVGGSPEVLLVRDRPLLASVLLWVVVSGAILYWA